MPIEIRELTIKTEVRTALNDMDHTMNNRELEQLRTQLMEECKRLIAQKTARKKYKR